MKLDPLPAGDRPLTTVARPIHYGLTLWLDPASARFRGVLDLELELAQATTEIRLHGEGLRFEHAEVRGPSTGLLVTEGPAGALALRAHAPLAAGRHSLHLRWTGAVSSHPEGLYPVEVEGRSYLFTQFQPLAARRVFPCFDEPRFKATLALTVHAPAGHTVAANGRCLERRGDGTEVCWRFATTPPLPTYLVAFVVGPFDVVEAPGGLRGASDGEPRPLRALTPRGRGPLARFALDLVPPMVVVLERWCGRPFPFEKLDLVAVPDFAAGAMENVGLITFRERLLLVEPGRSPPADLRWTVLVLAHELAHMWFGNLVTVGWWDELWLSEAFATLLEAAVSDEVAPEFAIGLDMLRDVARVMDHDALAEARPIRQAVLDAGDIRGAFDSLAYTKGAALLHMAATWLGPEPFQEGVRHWLRRYAHQTAATPELMDSMERTTRQAVAPVLADFLDQPGVPWVQIDATPDACVFRIQARRFSPAGVSLEARRWQVPVRLRYGDGREEHTLNLLLSNEVEEIRTVVPPIWLHPNADEAGYYRWRLPTHLLTSLAGPRLGELTLRERTALPGHLWALLEAGALDAAVLLETLLSLAGRPERTVVEATLDVLDRLARRLLPDSHRPAFAARVRAVLGPHAARLGLWPRRGEPVGDGLLRPGLLGALVRLGDDPGVRAALSDHADRSLAEPAPDPAVAACAWPVAAASADQRRFSLMCQALSRPPSPGHRALLIHALGCIEDPALLPEALALFHTPLLRAHDLHALLRPMSRHRAGRDAILRWLDARFPAVMTKAGEGLITWLPRIITEVRTASERAGWELLFAPSERRPPGTDRALRPALEAADRNIRLNARASSALRLALGGLPNR